MQKLHQKLTQKYQAYNNWHNYQHHNKIHWGIFIIFTLVLFSFIISPVQLNFQKDSSIIVPTIQTQKTTAAGTWQQTLESNFDIADTFDDYQDWKGLAGRTGSECQTNPNDLPKHQNGTNGLWDMYCYSNDSMPGDYGNWIANHGPSYQVGSKSLKLGTQGHNAAEIKTYIGDGNPSSGYSDIYVFYRLYLPKNTWPTYIVKSGNSGTWPVSQPVPPQGTGIMGYQTGNPYLFLTGWKFFNFGTGFCNVEKWEDPTDGDNICGGGFYGDGPSVYGGAELWYNLIYNDPNPYTISASASRISAQPPLLLS